MEVYSIEMNHLPLEERAKLDYEAPHAIDVKLLDRQIRAYSSGQSIKAPMYDFAKPPYDYFRDLFTIVDAEPIKWIEKSRDLMISWGCVAIDGLSHLVL
jgi:uridine kinase